MTDTLDGAVAALRERGWISAGEEACTRLCMEEALVNAIRHGNRGDERRMVGLEMINGGNQCTIRIRDEGAGFDPGEVRLPPPDQLGGRGVCIMRHYMERVAYNQELRCLELVFRRTYGSEGE